MRRASAMVCVAAGAALALAGCSEEATPVPSPSASSSPAVETPAADATEGTDATPQGVSAEVTYLGAQVLLDVHPLEVQDGVALLTIDFALAEGAPAELSVPIGQVLAPITGPVGTGLIRVVDFGAGLVYPAGEDATAQPAVTRDYLPLTAAAPVTSQGFYGAPESDSVGVLFPYFAMVLDVPVVTLAAGDEFAVTPSELGREGEITYSAPSLETFTEGYDASISARVEGLAATVALASDVLFGVDEAVLTPAAEQVVVAAAAEIDEAATGGEVSVVGHTDDVASDEYNQDLSVRRAQAVATVLATTLGASFAVTPTGLGESQPAVVGTTREARAANRRVELAFTATETGAVVEVEVAGASVPAPTGPTATGTAPVDVAFEGGQFRVRALSVTRHEGYLVGELEAEATSAGSRIVGFFGTRSSGAAGQRGFSELTRQTGAHSVTLLGASSRYYPIDYVRQESTGFLLRTILADQTVTAVLEQDDTITVSVVWPDPGGDTVTIDVADRFRLVDVPVTA